MLSDDNANSNTGSLKLNRFSSFAYTQGNRGVDYRAVKHDVRQDASTSPKPAEGVYTPVKRKLEALETEYTRTFLSFKERRL